MSSSRRNLAPGDSTVFTTRPVGLKTTLFARPTSLDPAAPLASFVWHIELCCQPDHVERSKVTVDISSAAGALVTVRNIDHQDIQVFTDYI